MFYALEYAYGPGVINDGNRPDRVFRFATDKERIEWVNAGPDDLDAPGYRDAIRGTSKAAQKARREAAKGLDWRDGIPV